MTRLTSPAYLLELAATYARSAKLEHNATAERLLEIAAELDHLTAGGTVVAQPRTPPRDLTIGTNRKLADLRRAKDMPAPTLEELKALRAEIAAGNGSSK